MNRVFEISIKNMDNNKDRRELLLIKQSTEEDEDNIFRSAKEKYIKPITKKDDVLFYLKWILLLVGIAALVVISVIRLETARDLCDIRVMLVSFDHDISRYEEPLKAAVEKVCPDTNGDGSVSALIYPIDLTARGTGSGNYAAEEEKLSSGLGVVYSQMIISDEEFFSDAVLGSYDADYFVSFSDKFPAETLAFDGRGIRAAKLLPDLELPDNVIIYVRAALSNSNNSKKAAEYRAIAEDVLLKLKNGG